MKISKFDKITKINCRKFTDELSEKQTPSEVQNSLTASQRSESDDDLNFVVQPTQGPLKSFTKVT